MRTVFIGVSHWHTPFYLDPALGLPWVTIAGVSDPDHGRAQDVADRAGCRAWGDYRAMCEDVRPDFAFALGRHNEMAATARFLIDRRIPFAIEKPSGINAADVRDIAARAREARVFAAVPFVFRDSELFATIREIAAGEAVHCISFKFIGGMLERYRDVRCAWMLDRAAAGGGALINLGVHFLDLCRVLLPEQRVTVCGATMSTVTTGIAIEEYAVVLLRAGATPCLVETGYLYPAPNSVFDMHYSIRTERHYFTVRDASSLEIVELDRRRRMIAMPTINAPLYPRFVAETLRRVAHGERPIADLADMTAVMELVEASYAASDRMSPTMRSYCGELNGSQASPR